MSKLPRIPLILALLAIPFASVSKAAPVTLDTTTMSGGFSNNTSYSNGSLLADGTALTQTFTNTAKIDTLTFRFITTGAPSVSAQTLDVYFSNWSGNNATTSIGVGTFELPATGSWTTDGGESYYDMAFDMTSVAGSLTPANTYGLSIVGNAATSGGNLRLGAGDTAYADGATHSSAGVSTFANLTSGGTAAGADFAFIANSAAGYDAFAPVPEASTVAVLFAGAFVGLMAARRIRQRRQQSELPAQA